MANIQGDWFQQLGLAATGTGPDTYQVRGSNYSDGIVKRGTLWVTGTFVGSVQLQGSQPSVGAYGIKPGTVITTPTSLDFVLNSDEDIQVNVTAYTSGAIDVRIHMQ